MRGTISACSREPRGKSPHPNGSKAVKPNNEPNKGLGKVLLSANR